MTELVIDARVLASGIGTYGWNVLSRLARTSLRDSTRVITSNQSQASLQALFPDVKVSNAPVYSVREQLSIPRHIPGESLCHALHYNAPLLHRGPLLVTIHDLTHLLDENYRKDWRSWMYSRPMLTAAARRAEHIFTGTQYVKNCIVEHLKVPESKITISSYGVGDEFVPGDLGLARETVNRCTRSASSYLLFVGNLKPHKNVANLLRAFANLVRDPDFHHRLLIVGDDRRGRIAVEALIRELQLARRVQIIPELAHADLIDFYRAADLLVLPSFQEGFGLPIAEAMACGTPVACSRAASMPEVGGDAAAYFDPHHSEDIAHAIVSVLSSPEKQKQMSLRGRAQVRKFTWDFTFGEHLRVYRSYLSGSLAAAAD